MQVLQPVDVECVCERDYVEQLKNKSLAPVLGSRKVHPGGSGGTGGILVPGGARGFLFCITNRLRLSDTEPKEFHRSTYWMIYSLII